MSEDQTNVPGTDPTSFLDKLEEDIAKKNSSQEQEQPTTNNEEETKKEPSIIRVNEVQNVETKLDPITKGTNKHRPETLTTLPTPSAEFYSRISNLSQTDVADLPGAQKWAANLQLAIQSADYGDQHRELLKNPKTKWVQSIKYGNFNIGPSASRPTIEDGAILTGTQALQATQRHLGLGGNFTNVLPHSGFWFTLKPPLEDTYIELHRQYNLIKTEVGRATYGLALTAHTGLASELFVRFALTGLTRSSIKDVDNILKLISCHDIDIIIWSYVCTMYPNGFNHRQACIADPTKCSHVEEDLINVRRLFYMDQNSFSENQLKHLTSNTQSSMTVDSIVKYQQEMKEKDREVLKIAEGTESEIHFVVCVPSAFDYFDSTNRWINSISVKVIDALGADSPYNERNTLINEYFSAGELRKYSHWIEEIRVAGGIIKNREDIENNLEAISSSSIIREELLEKIKEYVIRTKKAVIGVPDFKCSKCGEYQISEKEVDPIARSIIAIDVIQNFFITLVQRVQYAQG